MTPRNIEDQIKTVKDSQLVKKNILGDQKQIKAINFLD